MPEIAALGIFFWYAPGQQKTIFQFILIMPMQKTLPLSTLQIPAFHSHAFSHGIFRRYGGESKPPFDSLNVSFGVGDDPERVRRNRRRIKMALNLPYLVSSRQVHQDRVLVVDRAPESDFEADGFDALITDQRGIGLMIQQADCQAVLLADPALKAIGICHVGWRGSVANIIGKTVTLLEQQFGVNPANLLAAVSPSLGPCCAEFVNYRQELPEVFWTFQTTANHFDFWSISGMQLQDAGVLPENISISGICPVCDPAFFSYRREKKTGRFASVLGITDVAAT
jgi:YfiH family protein